MTQTNAMTEKKRTLIFINILIVCIASSFLLTALATALPPIISDLNVDVNTGQWLTSAYTLVMGIMMPLTAFLITRFPAKPLYLTAIGTFLVGLGICIFAKSFIVMMIGRILQACSNGVTSAMAQVLLLSIYPKERHGTVMGWYGLSVGAAPVVAPTIAGILADNFGWRMIFIIPFVILLIAFIYAWLIFDNVLENHPQKFDVGSFLLSILAFGGLTLGIGNVSSQGLTAPTAFIPLIVGVIGGIIFIRRQLSMENPFLQLRVMQKKQYALGVIGSMLLYLTMMGTALLMPLYIQSVLGHSATTSGLVMLPGSLAMMIVSPMAGKLYDKVGMKTLAIIGSVCLIIFSVGLGLVTEATPLALVVVINAVRSVAVGCLLMPFVTWGMAVIDRRETAHGTALLTSLRTISGAIGEAMFVGIMTSIAAACAVSYGEKAGIHSINLTFWIMTVFNVILLVISILAIKSKAGSAEQAAK